MADNLGKLFPSDVKSQLARKQYVRRLLQSFETNVEVSHPLFLALVRNHPDSTEKIGRGIDYFYIEAAPAGVGRQLCFERVDGSRDHVSIHSCVAGRGKGSYQNYVQALRHSILDQIQRYKFGRLDANNYICDARDCLCVDNLEVDHAFPSFKELVETFSLKRLIHPGKYDSHPVYNYAVFRAEDKDIAERFKAHHKEHALLQLLCPRHHKQKTAGHLTLVKPKESLEG